ncbi:BrnA antitoxin family protein [Crenothrix sp.]|uniref:BrnA antitoxin family protein n=1 Tax=Crenothrix sp. TaxID=3100433 RepID=UPI00374D4AF6
MNKNSTSPMSNDTLDEYPEVNQNDLNRAIRRRSFVEVSKKQNITIALDSDIINWFKEKSGEKEYQSLINATLRDVIRRNP